MAFYIPKQVYPTITTNKMTNPTPKKSRRSNTKSSNSNRSKREISGFISNNTFDKDIIADANHQEDFIQEIEISENKMRRMKEMEWAIRMNNISANIGDNDYNSE